MVKWQYDHRRKGPCQNGSPSSSNTTARLLGTYSWAVRRFQRPWKVFFGWPASLAGSPASIRGGPPFGEGLTDPPPLSPHMDIYVLASAKNDAVADVPEKPTARNVEAHSGAAHPPPSPPIPRSDELAL